MTRLTVSHIISIPTLLPAAPTHTHVALDFLSLNVLIEIFMTHTNTNLHTYTHTHTHAAFTRADRSFRVGLGDR